MILMADLFAPTVPSEPRPQNLHCTVPSGVVESDGPTGRDSPVTSSSMPTTKWFLALAFFMLSYTAWTMFGRNSLEPRP